MKKRLLALIAVAALCGTLLGCGGAGRLIMPRSAELRVGESVSVACEESGAVYRSTNDAVVTVSEAGEATAAEVGSAVIIAEKDGRIATCIVSVTGERPVEIRSLEVDSDSLTVDAGQTFRLGYSKIPENADNYTSIVWTSSNEEIASVTKDGLLKTLSPGTVVLTLIARGTEVKKDVTLTVRARPNTLTLDYDDVTGLVGGEMTVSADFFTDYKDADAPAWSSDNKTVADIDREGRVRFLAPGRTSLRCRVTAGGETLERVVKTAVLPDEGFTVIRTPDELQSVSDRNGKYMLGNDVNMTAACAPGGSLYHGGAGFAPLFGQKASAFAGVFDGQGYAIRGLVIRSTQPYTALIGYLSAAAGKAGVIRNLALLGGKIEGGNLTAAFVSAFDGNGSPDALLENCLADIELVSTGSAGGIVAYNAMLVRRCVSLSKITAAKAGSLCFTQYKNGATGFDDCYALASINPDLPLVYTPQQEAVFTAEALTEDKIKDADSFVGWPDVWRTGEGLPSLASPNQR